ncbi:hypothetical protein CALVIDRAFT_491517, partial [Calocera viscosa TUFC12733]
IFCTESFRIPFAGREAVSCFDTSGAVTAESLVVEGAIGMALSVNPRKLDPIMEAGSDTTWYLSAGRALVPLDEGDLVGDPMEKSAVEAMVRKMSKGAQNHTTAA